MRVAPREPIVVSCAADGDYVMPLAVMLTSLVDRLDVHRALDVYVADGGVPAADRDRLSGSLERPNVRIHWVAAQRPDVSRLPLWGRLRRAVYQRLLIGDLLPGSVRKAIWLDCDLVVQQDLARLWDVDAHGRCLLAVQDMIVPYVSSFLGIARHAELGIAASAKYFNAGVMVVDLGRWREDDVHRRVVDYLHRYRDDVVFLEQEGLNAVLAGRWGELDARWNQNASVAGRSFFAARHLDEQSYAELVRDPWIVHFSGNIKPWMFANGHPSSTLYYQYLDRTYWAGWRPKRSLVGTLAGMYDASRLRNVLYPSEKWVLEAVRRLTRRRLERSGPDDG